MSRDVAVRAVLIVLLVLIASAFVIDWNALVGPSSRRWTNDALLEGNPVQLSTRVAGDLTVVPVHDDSAVRAGALLFGIDPSDYAARYDRATAETLAARAAIAAGEAEIAVQLAELDSGRARIAAAQADLQRVRLERLRQQKLLHTESYLQRDWQQAVAAEQSQQATLDGDRRALAASQAQVAVSQADLLGQRATLAAQQAALSLAAIELGYTRIVAPFAGVVTSRLARLGEYVAPGRVLITLVPLRDIWVVANFREVQMTHMRPGQSARITIDALPGVRLRGHVDSIEPTSQARGSVLPPDRATGSFTMVVQRIPVKIVLDARPDLDGKLRPGLSAEVWVDTGDQPRELPGEAP